MIMFMRMCNGMSMCCSIMCMSESVLMFMHMMSDQGICNNKCRSCSHDRQRSDIETCGVEENVQQLYIDRQNVMYVCNQTEGLSYYHSSFRKFSNHQTQQTKNLSAVIEDHAGNVWMGTDGHDLLCMKPDGSITTMDIPGHIVITLMEDREGRLWIGTYLNGLLCVDKGKVTHYTKENSGLSDNSIYSLCQDKAGYIWIGSLWGILQRFNPDSGEWKDGSPGTPVYQAYCMYYDDDNNLCLSILNSYYIEFDINIDLIM